MKLFFLQNGCFGGVKPLEASGEAAIIKVILEFCKYVKKWFISSLTVN